MKAALIPVAAALLLTGCTTRAWYDAFQAQQRLQCEKYPQGYEKQLCLQRANALTYDQYEYQREQLKEKR